MGQKTFGDKAYSIGNAVHLLLQGCAKTPYHVHGFSAASAFLNNNTQYTTMKKTLVALFALGCVANAANVGDAVTLGSYIQHRQR